MKVSVIVPDQMIVVDGLARQVDMSGLPAFLHAMQWDGTVGDMEYGKPIHMNVPFTDLAPFQFLVDRWTAAGAVPPPPPPTKDEEVQRTFSDRVLKAMIQEIVFRLGIAQQDFIDAVKARLQ